MMNRRQTLLTLAVTTLLGACATPRPPLPAGLAAGRQLPMKIDDGPLNRMWVWLPPDYEQKAERWPLVVFLHGSGERGTELDAVLRNGPPMHVAKGEAAYPFVLVSPQLREDREWEPAELHQLLLALQSRFFVDTDRSLATGLSLGGHGVWNWATAYPGDLAGIAPVCGHGDPSRVAAMKRVPVRAYHGDRDDVVPLAGQQACIDALRAAGDRDIEFIIYPGVNHGSWIPAYKDPQLTPWLLSHRRT
ncbi:alpha/beta hydrolase-fold protein [Pelomonas sp. KK5]|uniref:carboxylesterase family protein n=1 Tax=Pelomonas sp. KK5 TaxID=1855730 RepID=UPI00097BEEF7|nr:alpha/beta hydrolase-fold protein [Pelomonas sp. KK5]